MEQLNAILSGLGPWGLVIGAALMGVLQWYRSRQPAGSQNPLLDAALALLKLRLSKQMEQPVARDIDDETLNRLIGAVPPVGKTKGE